MNFTFNPDDLTDRKDTPTTTIVSPVLADPQADRLGEIRRYLEMLHSPGDVFEIRVLGGRKSAGFFDDIDAAAQAVAAYDRQDASGVYVALNPVNSDLLNRSPNRMRGAITKGSASDTDIVRRQWLFIDIDPDRPAETAATDTERATAEKAAEEIERLLSAKGWPKPAKVDSGNGCYLLYRVDLPNDAESLKLVKAFLAGLDPLRAPYDTTAVYAKVDATGCNAARILRVAGTMNRKGTSTVDRPHRRAQLLAVDAGEVVSREKLAEIAAFAPVAAAKPAKKKADPYEADRSPYSDSDDKVDIEKYLRHYGVEYWTPKDVDGAVLYRVKCPFGEHGGRGDSGVYRQPGGLITYGCKHNSCQGKTWHDFEAATGPVLPEHFENWTARPIEATVDFSQFTTTAKKCPSQPATCDRNELACSAVAEAVEPIKDDQTTADIPHDFFRVPGFIGDVMAYTLATAAYPNVPLAWAGAMCLQSVLCGQKLKTEGDVTPNVYLLALAPSASGKDRPRKVNAKILGAVGMGDSLYEQVASGEGLEDALAATPVSLLQTDEIDGMLLAMNNSKDSRYESIMSMLLRMYSDSEGTYTGRVKAGTRPVRIQNPHLSLFGTAIPNHYYKALSERMMTNGLFSRMMVVESGTRSVGQDPQSIDLPASIVSVAEYWRDAKGDGGNLGPVARAGRYSGGGKETLSDLRRRCEAEYGKAERRGDDAAMSVWGRVDLNARKLALLYAASVNHADPTIDGEAAEWAADLATRLAARMLDRAEGNVSDSPFQALLLKVTKWLREAPGKSIPHSKLLKKTKGPREALKEVTDYLVSVGDVAWDAEAHAWRLL